MSRFDRPENVPVRVGACDCPNTPHADGGDFVYLAPVLSMAGGMAAVAALSREYDDPIMLQEHLAKVWIRHGVVAWNFLDEDGEPVPLTPHNIEAGLPYAKGGRLVADKADDLYAQDVLAPFLELAAKTQTRRTPRSSGGSTGTSSKPTSSTPRSRSRQR